MSSPTAKFNLMIGKEQKAARIIFHDDKSVLVDLHYPTGYENRLNDKQTVTINRVDYHADLMFRLHSDGHFHFGFEFKEGQPLHGFETKELASRFDNRYQISLNRADRGSSPWASLQAAEDKLIAAVETAMRAWEQTTEFKIKLVEAAMNVNEEEQEKLVKEQETLDKRRIEIFNRLQELRSETFKLELKLIGLTDDVEQETTKESG